MSKQYQLPREFAEKWVKALRSGEYKQGKECLGNKDNGYCCLGIAAITAGATDKMLLKSDNTTLANYLTRDEFGPKITNKIFENIPQQLIGLYGNQLVTELTSRNDSGQSFTEIADWIEQNVEFV